MKKKSNPNRSSGVLLHITSLPGPYGIGEIGIESKRFVDNLVSMGQNYWQILPTNYPEQCNSPYDTNSAFAQNPFLISLDDLIEDELIKSSDLENRGCAFPDYESAFKVAEQYRKEWLAENSTEESQANVDARKNTADFYAGGKDGYTRT